MFDLLPDEAVPPEVQLSDQLEAARNACRERFKALTASPERDGLLSALGRVGKSNLKQKVRYRAQRVIDLVGDKFPELIFVIDQAVDCRNHYVHGGTPRLDYVNNSSIVNFLTDTLEFVFAASDLIEAGWDITSWSNTTTTMSHPFSAYRATYEYKLQRLTSLVHQPDDPDTRTP